MDRRALLGTLTVAMALPRLRWGERGGADRLGRIGIQLYTVRELVRKDFEGTLAALRAIGFEEVEFAGYPPGKSGAEVRAMLERVGLAAPAAHVDLPELRDQWSRTLDFAAAVGHRYVVLAWLPVPERSLERYRRLAELLNRSGEIARSRGIALGYHNHDFEFATVEGSAPFDLLLERTDPALVQFELDLYWVTKAGRDPLPYFAKSPGRFPLLHVKDLDAQGGFTEVGRGRIDFGRIFREAARGGAKHYFFEQDRTAGSPLDSARASYQYLKQLTF